MIEPQQVTVMLDPQVLGDIKIAIQAFGVMLAAIALAAWCLVFKE